MCTYSQGFVGTQDWNLLYSPAYGSEYITLRRLSAVMGALLIGVSYMATRAAGAGRVGASGN